MLLPHEHDKAHFLMDIFHVHKFVTGFYRSKCLFKSRDHILALSNFFLFYLNNFSIPFAGDCLNLFPKICNQNMQTQPNTMKLIPHSLRAVTRFNTFSVIRPFHPKIDNELT